MTDDWVKSRVDGLSKSRYGEIKNETAKIIKEAMRQKRPINKIIISVEHDQAIMLNLGRFEK
ncbi:hypothetical protein [Cardiobacterium valvarum]|uniref:Uncharacterized protein n=1 Tax=Cardiobacterium valvarum F0432 TaxID=797473 RepID=G9ZDZ2_9GAMM|nr:hypothetical protein [Cardiobacterium valvarum]EHM55079.1 hypothetical protein HMPREF9080_00977 [Cardiobacterium valvarum F0432]